MASIKPLLCPHRLRGLLSSSPLPSLSQAILQSPIRSLGNSARAASTSTSTSAPEPPQIPPPTPLVPDVTTFLTVIGRDLKQHAAKIPDWEALFTLSSEQLRELGVEPPRSRKYLLRWRQRFRLGQYGIGGDLRHVEDGVAQLRVLEADPAAVASSAGAATVPRKFVVNIPAGRTLKDCDPTELSRVRGYHVEGARTIVGPYALPLKEGEGARITVTDGMWEDRRGHKIDGGERRRTEIRYKRRIAERREARERGELY
ncbi:IGR protein motif-domain-containing protein [Hypoxylon argillaceum]|nr:IGR protein motif-domain-containing protein [Hypoxylon argillaceum]KAI1155764.1 IGR protein motif-domain-containing protein [Nemania diffusa]